MTNFFRDPAFFEKLKEKALYPIVQNANEEDPIRVWSAGCSTGEEAYSLAILFQEILEELRLKRDIKFSRISTSRLLSRREREYFPRVLLTMCLRTGCPNISLNGEISIASTRTSGE